MTMTELERRLATVERQLAKLTAAKKEGENVNAWLDDIQGTFKDDAMYREAARLGRAWRKGQVPPAKARPRSSHGAKAK